jgi:hypothetical protein
VSLARPFSTAALMGSLSSIQRSHQNALLTTVNITNGTVHVTDVCRRSFNRKAQHGSKKKKRRKTNPIKDPALPLQKKMTLQERLALEDEQARQRLLYRKSTTPPKPGITGESRKHRRNQEKEREHDAAKWKRILSASDYWFSDINLRKDAVLRNILKRYHGYVPVKIFLSFPKFHYWTDGPLLVHAFKSAEDRYKVRFDPNLWRPPFPPDYVKPETDWPIQSEEEAVASSMDLGETMNDNNSEAGQQSLVNGASTKAHAIDEEEEDDEDVDDSEKEDWDVSVGEGDDTEFDSDTVDRSDDEDYSDEDRSDEEYSDNDQYSDDDVEDGGLVSRGNKQRDSDAQGELHSDRDEDGFDDGDGTGWFDALDLTRKDGHREEEDAQDYYDPGLSDDSEDERTVRKRNAMWSNDNTYHAYNAFVRHRRVSLKYIESLEQEIAECERRNDENDVDEDQPKTG